MQNHIRGVSHVKLPSEGYRPIGGYKSYSITVSRYTAPLSRKKKPTCRQLNPKIVPRNSYGDDVHAYLCSGHIVGQPRTRDLKVPEGHHLRLSEKIPLRGVLRGLCRPVSPRITWGTAGLCRGPRDFSRVFPVMTLCL